MATDDKERVRAALVASHPEWRGKIWVGKQSVTVRGVGNVPREDNAADVLLYFEDMIERHGL